MVTKTTTAYIRLALSLLLEKLEGANVGEELVRSCVEDVLGVIERCGDRLEPLTNTTGTTKEALRQKKACDNPDNRPEGYMTQLG
jgi:hypothetical protein